MHICTDEQPENILPLSRGVGIKISSRVCKLHTLHVVVCPNQTPIYVPHPWREVPLGGRLTYLVYWLYDSGDLYKQVTTTECLNCLCRSNCALECFINYEWRKLRNWLIFVGWLDYEISVCMLHTLHVVVCAHVNQTKRRYTFHKIHIRGGKCSWLFM